MYDPDDTALFLSAVCEKNGEPPEAFLGRRLIGLNRSLRDEHGKIYDIVAGAFLVVGPGPESFASPPPGIIRIYTEQFKRPELFASLGGQIASVPVEPENPLRTAELEKAQNETCRAAPETRLSIRERLEDAKRECADQKSLDQPAPQKKPPELGDV